MSSIPAELDRYRKQILFASIGLEGQKKLRDSQVLLVGCGALGSAIADSLTRAGIGRLRIADRDFVDLTNLQRQVLFDERDVTEHLPKAIAAQQKLARINSQVEVEAVVADVTAENIRELISSCDLILDGTDNFETRFLLNDISLETGVPWISGGLLGAAGQVMTIVPGRTACLRCVIESEPPTTETCDTAGVLGPAVNLIASLQVTRALQLLTHPEEQPDRRMTVVEVWQGTFQQIDLSKLVDNTDCPACAGGERLWLNGVRGSRSQILCGRNAVQITPGTSRSCDISALAAQLQPIAEVKLNPFLLWFSPFEESQFEFHVFPDGRAIVKGTEDLSLAKSLYARFLGA